MKHESGGNANAVNQNSQGGSYKWDVGLWYVIENIVATFFLLL